MRRVLRYKDGAAHGYWQSRTTLHRLRQDPTFPKAIVIGGSIAFFEDEIRAWLDSRPRRDVEGVKDKTGNALPYAVQAHMVEAA